MKQNSDKFLMTTGWYEQAKLIASDGENQDMFGCSVSIKGDTAIIGVELDDDNEEESGSVYVFKYDGFIWNKEVKLLASDPTNYSYFGRSISFDGDIVIIGATRANGNVNRTGSAYVFKRNGSKWEEKSKLIASDGSYKDSFGDAVSLDGDTAIVGAMYDDDNGISSGSAYVFRYDGITWNEEAKLLPSDGTSKDEFGRAVSISGDYAVIGAYRENAHGHQSGSAYIFKRNGDNNWTEEAKLTPSDGAEGDMFGISASLDGNIALIGAMRNDDNGHESGSAYIFKRNGNNWTEEAKLTPSDGGAFSYFGKSVSLDGDAALIGAFGDDDFIGAAYLFQYNGTSWIEKVKLRAAYEGGCDWFGESVSLDGDTALVGAIRDNDVNGTQVGAAYIFKKGIGPDLDYNGSLRWTNVKHGDSVEGNFTVKNIGESGSNLEWEITEFPNWGNWTFTPGMGVGLTPENEPLIVNVTVISPDEVNKEFIGKVRVVNKHNRSDYCFIPVYLKTRRNKANYNSLFLSFTSISGYQINNQNIVKPSARGDILYVGGSGPGNYSKIQEAIINASDGDTVFVFDDSSPYFEWYIFINKSINLIGENRDTTIIDGAFIDYLIYINSSFVNITNFTLQNAEFDSISTDFYYHHKGISIRECNILNSEGGIYLENVSNILIENCYCYNSDGTFITTYEPSYNIIINNCEFDSCNNSAIIIQGSNFSIGNCKISNNTYYGVDIDSQCKNIRIFNNTIKNNNDAGITVREYGTSGESSNITIENNLIKNNGQGTWFNTGIFLSDCLQSVTIKNNQILQNNPDGIYLLRSNKITIFENNISYNIGFGINLRFSSSHNKIFQNNLLENSVNAYDEGENTWNDYQYGNYWSDYEESYPFAKPKLFKPWMWNTPYRIPGGFKNYDNCPLIKQWPNSESIDIPKDKAMNHMNSFRILDRFPLLQHLFDFWRSNI
jgi:parallel beta-helix repeat protein